MKMNHRHPIEKEILSKGVAAIVVVKGKGVECADTVTTPTGLFGALPHSLLTDIVAMLDGPSVALLGIKSILKTFILLFYYFIILFFCNKNRW